MIKKMRKLTATMAAVLLIGSVSLGTAAAAEVRSPESPAAVCFSDSSASGASAPLPTASEDDIPDTGGASAGLTSIVAILFAAACIVVKKNK